MIEYQLYDTEDASYPIPKVPILPQFAWPHIGTGSTGVWQLLGSKQSLLPYKRGRYALHEAFRLCKVDSKTRVLLPALHCRTMLDPAIRLGARVNFYHLGTDLAPDIEHLRQCIAKSAGQRCALLVTHYFGKPQNMAPLASLCREFDVALVEDCSHAYFDFAAAPRLGLHGRYTIASPYKFLACDEGGLLIARQADGVLGPAPRAAGLADEARTLIHTFLPGRTKQSLAAVPAKMATTVSQFAPAPGKGRFGTTFSDEPSTLYEPVFEGVSSSRLAHALARSCDIDRVAALRRANFAYWTQATRDVPACHPLFAGWPADAVPYMFPLVLHKPDMHFHLLKHLGLPIWRWDEVAITDCRVSMNYSRSLLHLPCHQSLKPQELAWMTESLSQVLRAI